MSCRLTGIGSSLKELAAKGEALTSCVKAADITHWGLSQCRPMLKKVESRIDQYENIRAYSSSFVAPMFDSNSAELKDKSPNNPTLAPLLVLLKSYPDRKILIVGHSDNTGSDAFNLALSEQRAINVRNWLLKYTPHTFNDFIIRGKGALEPIASNATKEGQTQNRRVDVLLIPSNEPEMETDIK
ncbi:OmpA family protein [Ewingella americana]